MQDPIDRVAHAINRGFVLSDDHPWDSYRDAARSVLRELREPTEAMLAAGAFPRENGRPVAEVWQAMVDALLAEGGPR